MPRTKFRPPARPVDPDPEPETTETHDQDGDAFEFKITPEVAIDPEIPAPVEPGPVELGRREALRSERAAPAAPMEPPRRTRMDMEATAVTPHPSTSFIRVGLPSGRILDIDCGTPLNAAHVGARLTKASAIGSRGSVVLPGGAIISIVGPEFVIYHRGNAPTEQE